MSYDSEVETPLKPPISDAALIDRTRAFAFAQFQNGSPEPDVDALIAYHIDVIELGDRLERLVTK